ncbi:hypothetical protein [Mesorhizobium sp. AA22]|uniref:hypothetical protein n=1 Tax=Mesorhizobium sp. AA22 TaxID=1854057 RepID=UPI001398A0CB|nr:hypothetical protein [Mesorhizobium sp. AA22]QIA20322.1 hypothetical protein A9K68_014905 [Mesorhizobium sp. AA22]
MMMAFPSLCEKKYLNEVKANEGCWKKSSASTARANSVASACTKALGTGRKRKISIALYIAAIPLAFVNQWIGVALSTLWRWPHLHQGPHHRWRAGRQIRRRQAVGLHKLTIDFDKAGQKRVLDGFVTGV